MKVSIITVNFNEKEGLERTIQSIRSQSFSEFEYIIVDGGSTDGSLEIIKQNEDLITTWVSEDDDGIYDAMNKAVRMAHGEYLNFMNAGDSFVDEAVLHHIFSAAQHDDILYGDVITCKQGKALGKIINPNKISAQHLFNGGITHQAIFSRRSLHVQNPYSTEMPIIADWDFLIRRLFDNCSFKHVGIPVCNFDITGVSGSRSKKQTDEHTAQFIQVLDELVPVYVKEDVQELIRLKNPNNKHMIKHFGRLGLKGKIVASVLKILNKIPDWR